VAIHVKPLPNELDYSKALLLLQTIKEHSVGLKPSFQLYKVSFNEVGPNGITIPISVITPDTVDTSAFKINA